MSAQRQLAVLAQICHLSQMGTQFMIASHSPILLGISNAEILSFNGNIIEPIDYYSAESYQITSLFVNNRDMMLKKLL